jgi:endonuclease/exonuclease/phosphatase family metal-dependent hydrolase
MTDFLPRSPATSADGGDSTISVATFNIRTSIAVDDGRNMWWLRRRAAVKVIENLRAHVIGLQEVRPGQLRYLTRKLPRYDFYGFGRDNDQRGEHCPVLVDRDRFAVGDWSVRWLSPSPDVPGSRHPDSVHPRIVTTVRMVDRRTGTALRIMNVHLDHLSAVVRTLQVQQLAEMIASSDEPVVVLGDFNCNIDDPSLQPLFDSSLREALEGLPPRGPATATHHSFTGAVDGDRIDHIFVSPQVHASAAHIVFERPGGRLASDHWPVVAQLRAGEVS